MLPYNIMVSELKYVSWFLYQNCTSEVNISLAGILNSELLKSVIWHPRSKTIFHASAQTSCRHHLFSRRVVSTLSHSHNKEAWCHSASTQWNHLKTQRRTDSWVGTHLIFWSFVPRVQLEAERQPTEVEMEQLLCSIVNWKWRKEGKAVVQIKKKRKNKNLKDCLGRVVCRVPPGCVAPNDWSICSIVGAMAWELKWTPLKTYARTHKHTQSQCYVY